jgi:hypothetical protein
VESHVSGWSEPCRTFANSMQKNEIREVGTTIWLTSAPKGLFGLGDKSRG